MSGPEAPAKAETRLVRFADWPAASVGGETVNGRGCADFEGDTRDADRLLVGGAGRVGPTYAAGAGANPGGGASAKRAGRGVAAGDA